MKTELIKAYITRPLNRHERNLEIQEIKKDKKKVYVKYTYENHDFREMHHQLTTQEVEIEKKDLKEYKNIKKADNVTRWRYTGPMKIINCDRHMVNER